MATYKVIQDIEADDKLIGWMSPRQAIYAAIVVISGFLAFLLATKGAWWIGIIFLPHMILFALLAGPFVHDQPSEIWLLAKIRFALKPRKRIWNQSGASELVTINAPKRVERNLTDGLSQTEVRSRLSALASTIDSRGWAVKNVSVNMFAQPAYATEGSDRIIDLSSLPQTVEDFSVSDHEDILDERTNPTAQHLDRMISQTAETRRNQLVTQMSQPVKEQTKGEQWFVDGRQSSGPMPAKAPKKATAKKSHSNRPKANLRTLDPLQKPEKTPKPELKSLSDTARQWAHRDDLTVGTIAHQVKLENDDNSDDNEVVISLR